MDNNKLEDILKLLELQKQALTELALQLVTPATVMNFSKAGVSVQKAIVIRAKIERQVRGLATQH